MEEDRGARLARGQTQILKKQRMVRTRNRAAGMFQWVKPLTPKCDDLSLIPRTHMVEGDNESFILSSDFHTYVMACMPWPKGQVHYSKIHRKRNDL